jgi:hypothetical protein
LKWVARLGKLLLINLPVIVMGGILIRESIEIQILINVARKTSSSSFPMGSRAGITITRSPAKVMLPGLSQTTGLSNFSPSWFLMDCGSSWSVSTSQASQSLGSSNDNFSSSGGIYGNCQE